MKLSEFKYDLPSGLISLYPAENRDESRMMVVNRKKGTFEHKIFKNIVEYFDDRDVMVVNDTKVFPARLYGNKEKTGAKIEVFLLRELNKEMHLWDVLVDPARKIRVGNKLYFGEGDLIAEVIDNTTSRGRTIRFLYDGEHQEFYKLIDSLGETPLPKYIDRPVEEADRDRYQTISGLEIKGVDISPITLHSGLGSFRAVDVEDLTKHKMDSENYSVNDATADRVNQALDEKKRICSIGTTSMRTLESSVSANGRLKANEGWTDKFIFPPYEFKICNALLTNFHMPESTLLMMAGAFGGYDLIMNVYREAIKEKYRFLTYGDTMLII
jgi:S-adenosylmethionine:tRNA ribosyltransferase-isomerase